MTRLVRVHLGEAGYGDRAGNACVAFKRQMLSLLQPMEGAWLVCVSDEGRKGVEVVYDAEVTGTYQWASQAAELSPGIWETIRVRRNTVSR